MESNSPKPPGIKVKTYGADGPVVILVHGGPAAAGELAPVARELSDTFRVIEPWQRGSGDEPLTVARHVEDLRDVVQTHARNARPAIVGHSWGAMLTLAYAAAHPESAGPLVLVGCGTFDPDARAQLQATLRQRTGRVLQRQLDQLADRVPDPAQRVMAWRKLTRRLYVRQPIVADDDETIAQPFDIRAHEETWADMMRLQDQGIYPAAFAAIASPVLMLHGRYDPHPGSMIRKSLTPYIKNLQYREWADCGHEPWNERTTRNEFVTTLRTWLLEQLQPPSP